MSILSRFTNFAAFFPSGWGVVHGKLPC